VADVGSFFSKSVTELLVGGDAGLILQAAFPLVRK